MSGEENTMSDQTPDPDEQGETTESTESTEVIEPTETFETFEADGPDERNEPVTEQAAPRRGFTAGLHPVNILHLVFGVAFLGMVMNWALIESGAVETSGLRWLLPIPWVAAGAAGLIATAPRLRGR
jgi:hypothetical protein